MTVAASNYRTLLTVAESGWDADVVAQEHPFGIGFYRPLCLQAHHRCQQSGRISVNTDDVLSFNGYRNACD